MRGLHPRVPRYVYFARPTGQEGPVKIGCSELPAQRLQALADWSPYPLEIAAQVPGNFRTERALHEHFFRIRIHREWFHADPELSALVDALRAGTPLADAVDLTVKTGTWKRRISYSPNQRRYLSYAARLRHARDRVWREGHYLAWSDEVEAALHRWSRSYEAVPPAETLALFERCIADPVKFVVAHPIRQPRPLRQVAA